MKNQHDRQPVILDRACYERLARPATRGEYFNSTVITQAAE
ncbi:hypothetical protein [Mesorhizobium huakuii]